MRAEWRDLDTRIEEFNAELTATAGEDDACRRLCEIPGIGPLNATALVAAVGNGAAFDKGRDMAAWMGLVPRQYSTGGKQRLLGISNSCARPPQCGRRRAGQQAGPDRLGGAHRQPPLQSAGQRLTSTVAREGRRRDETTLVCGHDRRDGRTVEPASWKPGLKNGRHRP
jgi:hypothetical protein